MAILELQFLVELQAISRGVSQRLRFRECLGFLETVSLIRDSRFHKV